MATLSLQRILLLAAATAVASFAPCGHLACAPRVSARAPAVVLQGDMFKGLSNALGNAAGGAIEAIQQAASEAAGQEENPWEVERREKIALDPASAVPLPDSFDDAVRLSIEATSEALADGSNRLVIEFDTSAGDETYNLLSRTLKLVEPFLPLFDSQVLLPPLEGAEDAEGDEPATRLQLLFPDEGTAAFITQKWQLPAGTRCGSMPRAKFIPGVEALLIIAPSATEVPGLQRLLAEVEEVAFDTPVLLFNPKLVDMQSTGYGLVGRDLRNMVEATFNNCFTLKSYIDGALFKVHPSAYTVWREDSAVEGGYSLVYQSAARPSGDEVEDLLDPDEEGSASLSGFAAFVKGFQAM